MSGGYEAPLVVRPLPGVTITVDGPVDDETLAVAVCAHLIEGLAEPGRVLAYLSARVGAS